MHLNLDRFVLEIERGGVEFYDSLWSIYRDQHRVHPIPQVTWD